jgi:DNA-binding MarR family transcriptional regulator
MPSQRLTGPVVDHSLDPAGEFPLGASEYYFYLLTLVTRRRDSSLADDFAPTGLSLERWRALTVIRRAEGCSMKELALYTAVDRTTLTRAVDQLVRQGLVTRWVPDNDRRQVQVALTEDGEAVYKDAVQKLLASNARVLQAVPPRQLRDAIRMLQVLLRELVADEPLADSMIGFLRPMDTLRPTRAVKSKGAAPRAAPKASKSS